MAACAQAAIICHRKHYEESSFTTIIAYWVAVTLHCLQRFRQQQRNKPACGLLAHCR